MNTSYPCTKCNQKRCNDLHCSEWRKWFDRRYRSVTEGLVESMRAGGIGR